MRKPAKEPNTNTDDCATTAQKPLQLALGILSVSVVVCVVCVVYGFAVVTTRVANNNHT